MTYIKKKFEYRESKNSSQLEIGYRDNDKWVTTSLANNVYAAVCAVKALNFQEKDKEIASRRTAK